MSIADICNLIQVSEMLASSGQPEDEQFRDIARAGYQVVVNLAMPNSDLAIPEEGNIVTSLKMTYVHIPIPFDAPTISHLQEFINVMQAFSDRKIWIHCALNYRVSAFLYQYCRLVRGESPQQAGRVMYPLWQPNAVWQEFLAISREQLT